MAGFSNTPEALLGRNDSKNANTTCRGITGSGRPCRRALASPTARKSSPAGVVALVEEDGTVTEADFYCWQHKDQAEERAQEVQSAGKKARRTKTTELFPLQERSSIDTLVQKLGIEDRSKKKTKQSNSPGGGMPLKSSRPNDSGPSSPTRRDSKSRKRNRGFWASLCCAGTDDDEDYFEIIRHRRRTEQAARPPEMMESRPTPPSVPSENKPASAPPHSRKPATNLSVPPASRQQRASSNPQTGHLLALIPQHCSPQTTSSLLAELVKPISPADEEGYIYIFWLTPQANAAPTDSTARSLLEPPNKRPDHARRISDVMTEFSFDGNDAPSTSRGPATGTARNGKKRTIMLKIGRANNVTRRMNEWQRQCGYKLNLVRWYPYIPSSSSTPSPAPSPNRLYPDLNRPATSRSTSDIVRKVPCVKRVERLVHLELAENRVPRECDVCGREHREWFEVEASQEGVKAVDACVRRWVDWAEKQAGGNASR